MKLKKLDMRGFSHEIGLVLFVVIFAIAGVAYLVGSHADSVACPGAISIATNSTTCPPLPTPTPNPTTSTNTSAYTFIGKSTAPGTNETVSAYACVTKLSSTDWMTTGLFELSSHFAQPAGANFNWTATIINGSTTPIPNNLSVSQTFINDAALPAPAAVLNMFSNPQGENPLSFSYSAAGTPIKTSPSTEGNIAQGIHPVSLKSCAGTPPTTT